MKCKVLFFARDYQADFFIHLSSPKYESLLVTLTIDEKRRIERKGFKVTACFEEEFGELPIAEYPSDYLESSFLADRYQRYSNVLQRRAILGKEVAFWSRILDNEAPVLVINETVAIEISEVLHVETRKRGIRYASWMSLSIKDHFYWQSTPMHNSLDREIFTKEPGKESLSKAETYIKSVQSGAGKPFYVTSARGRYSIYNLARNTYWMLRCILTEHRYTNKAKNRAIFGDNRSFYKGGIVDLINSMIYSYKPLNRYSEFEFVFYPLHYEPEAVLFYMAEFFDNQEMVIENLCKCLRQNQILIVKEHPQQPGVLLRKRFRRLKHRVPNLLYLPAEYNTVSLIEQSKLILTLGSTAGLESLVLGKPVAVLGKVFYDAYEKVNKISSYKQLKEFMRAEARWNFPDSRSLTVFLSQIIQYSKAGNPFPHDDLYSQRNIANIVSAIEQELDEILVNQAVR